MGYNDIEERVFSSFQNPTNKETDAMANTHKRVAGVLLVLVAVALLGAGCKGESQQAQPENLTPDAAVEATPVADAGSEIPEGWQIYRNPAWGIEQLAYPEGWYYAELPFEAVGDENTYVVVFNTEPVALILYSDPVYPVELEVERGSTIEQEIQFTDNLISREQVILGGNTFTVVHYLNELVEREEVAYLFENRGMVYTVTGFADNSDLQIIANSLQMEVQ